MPKKLVAYFSATGNTAALAKGLAEATGADLYEIAPEVPYAVPEDLNWSDKTSRTTLEMTNLDSRPAIKDTDAKVENYDTVFVGFPIWWWIAPTIINTFLEKYDFTGKKVVLFATSGGSGFGKAVDNLQKSCPGSKIIEGEVFKPNTNIEELKAFANQY